MASLQQLYKVQDGKVIQLSDFNKMEDTYVADPVEVSFGENLTGWVLLPKDYDETKKYPAILDIHGVLKLYMEKCSIMRCKYGQVKAILCSSVIFMDQMDVAMNLWISVGNMERLIMMN